MELELPLIVYLPLGALKEHKVFYADNLYSSFVRYSFLAERQIANAFQKSYNIYYKDHPRVDMSLQRR